MKMCEEIQEKLLSGGPPGSLSGEQQAHARQCAACREALEAAPLARGLDREIGRASGFSSETLAQNWRKIHGRLGLGDQATPAGGAKIREAASRFNPFALLPGLLRHPALAGAAALLALAVVYLSVREEQPFARLAFAGGEVTIEREKSSTVGEGLHEVGVVCDARVEVGGGGAHFRYDTGTDLALAGGTRAVFAEKRELHLAGGEVWLHVRKNTGGFTVKTDDAVVRVIGTSFGVARNAQGTKVSVDNGTVDVSLADGAQAVRVNGGQSLFVSAGAAALGSPTTGGGVPDWVTDLGNREAAAVTQTLVPSVTSPEE